MRLTLKEKTLRTPKVKAAQKKIKELRRKKEQMNIDLQKQIQRAIKKYNIVFRDTEKLIYKRYFKY